jgi:hypothetical protein
LPFNSKSKSTIHNIFKFIRVVLVLKDATLQVWLEYE